MKKWNEFSRVKRTQALFAVSGFASIVLLFVGTSLHDSPLECRAPPNILSALCFAFSGILLVTAFGLTQYMQKAETLDRAISETEQRACILKLLNKYEVKWLGEKDIAYAQIVDAIMESGNFGGETSKIDVKITTLTFIQGYQTAISQSFTWMREKDIESIVKGVRSLDANWLHKKPKKEVN